MDKKPVRYAEAPWVYRGPKDMPRMDAAALVDASYPLVFVLPLLMFAHHYPGITLLSFAIICANWLRKLRKTNAFLKAHGRAPQPEIAGDVGTVIVTLWYEGVSYATDFGHVVIDDRYIHFEGMRSTFSLTRTRIQADSTDGFQIRDAPGYSINMSGASSHAIEISRAMPEPLVAFAKLHPAVSADDEIVGLPPLRPIQLDVTRFRRLRAAYRIACSASFVVASWYLVQGVLIGQSSPNSKAIFFPIENALGLLYVGTMASIAAWQAGKRLRLHERFATESP